MERDRAGCFQEQERNVNWKPLPKCWKPVVRNCQHDHIKPNNIKRFLVGDVGLEPTTR